MLAAHIGANAYATIQAAVNAAVAGQTITVDAGSYSELVTVTTPGITIDGAKAGVDARTRSGSGESIVGGFAISPTSQSSAFYINANDVTVDGFTIQGNTSPGLYGAGIVIAPGKSGTHIQNNIVQFNIAGLYLANASTTDPAVIQHNVFSNNNNAGGNSGRGIYSDGGVAGAPATPLTNVLINGNTFTQNLGGAGSTGYEAAIGLEAATSTSTQSNITITNNVMTGNGKGVLLTNANHVTIAGNTITNSQDPGKPRANAF